MTSSCGYPFNGGLGLKRSCDLPLTLRPVVGMSDHYAAGFVDTFHSHDQGQLSFATSGTITVVTEASAYVLPPHRAIWIPPAMLHEVRCRGPVDLNVLYIDPSLPSQPNICHVFDASQLVQALFREVLTFAHAYDEVGREGRIVALLLEEIARTPAILVSAPMPRDERLRRVCERIVADPADQRDLDHFAKIAGMGRRTFTRNVSPGNRYGICPLATAGPPHGRALALAGRSLGHQHRLRCRVR